jgi:hypothetical protein
LGWSGNRSPAKRYINSLAVRAGHYSAGALPHRNSGDYPQIIAVDE